MKPPVPVTNPSQLMLNLEIAAEREIDGVGMGVFTNGATYLTLRGLARMCGVDHAAIVRMTGEWIDTPLKPRVAKIREAIRSQGGDDSVAFVAVKQGRNIHHAIPDAVCMAVLEYYAFDAAGENQHALRNFRILARKGFREFVYSQVGYNPTGDNQVAWRQFHDRVSLNYNTVPNGYFSIFKELADMTVTLLRAGADLGPHFIPDISVGVHWAKYWKDENLEVLYGERKKYLHSYPSYFPQAASNPQEPYCYPDDALGEFRKWVRERYCPTHMPNYINKRWPIR